MFLELKGAVGHIELHLFEHDPHAEPVGGINNSAQERGQRIKHDDRVDVGLGRNRAHAPDKRARSTSHRHPDTDGLMGNRAEQRYRQQSVQNK